jgi:hypothetical protein
MKKLLMGASVCAFIALTLLVGGTESAHAQMGLDGAVDNFNLATGTAVQTTGDLNVRMTPSKAGAFIAVKPRGSRGVVTSGPVAADGYLWYYVKYEIGQSGWNVANWLARMSTTSIATGSSTAAIASFTATPANPTLATDTVTLRWDTTGVNRCWLFNSANYMPINDIDPRSSSYVVAPAWRIDAGRNRTQIVYTLNCLDVMATTNKNPITRTVTVTLGTSTTPTPVASSTDKLGLELGTAVQTTDPLNVRGTPSIYGAFLATKPAGSRGVIERGPVESDGRVWYYVNYEIGADGWNASGWLARRLSTSTVVSTEPATIVKFESDRSSVDATTTPITLSWSTTGITRCSLLSSTDSRINSVVDNSPANGRHTLTPNWRTVGANSVIITYTLRCQDASASDKKLVEATTKVTYTGVVKTSGRISTFIQSGATIALTGTAYGADVLTATILTSDKDVVYTVEEIPVSNNKWSKTIEADLATGRYTVVIKSIDGTEIARRSYTK